MNDIKVKTREQIRDIILQRQDFLINKHWITFEIEDEYDSNNIMANRITVEDYMQDNLHIILDGLKTENLEIFLREQYDNLEYENVEEEKKKINDVIDYCVEKLKEREEKGELVGKECGRYSPQLKQSMVQKISEEYYRAIENEPRLKDIMSRNQIVTINSAFSIVKKYREGGFSQREFELIEKLSENNPELNIDFKFVDEQLINKLGITNMYNICNNVELSEKLFRIKENNPQLLDYISNAISLYDNSLKGEKLNAIESIINYTEENFYNSQLECDNVKSIRDYINYSLFNNSTLNNIEYKRGGYRKNINELCNSEYEKLKKDIELSKEREKKSDIWKINDFNIKMWKKTIKNIIFTKNFGMDYSNAKDFIVKYGADLEFVNKKSKGGIEYKCLKAMSSISKIDDLDKLLELYNNIGYDIDPIDMAHMDNTLNLMYSKTFEEKMKETTDKVNESINSDNAKTINVDGKEVKMVELEGEFNLLTHSSSTGFSALGLNYEKKLVNGSYKKTWKYSPDRSAHVKSTTYITQDFLGLPPVQENGILYGFSTVNHKNIVTKGTTDINTYVTSFGYKASDEKNYQAGNISYNSRRVYSEVGIEKEGLNPDYVIILDDFTEDMVKNSLECAAEWEIPALYIDKQKIVNQQMQLLDEKLEDYMKDSSVGKLKEIVNVFETNKAGWLLNRKDEVDQSQTSQIDNSRFKEQFDKMELRIGELVKSEMCKMDKSQREQMIAFFKEEKEKYDFSKDISDKKISATQMSRYITEELEEVDSEQKDKEEKEDIEIY